MAGVMAVNGRLVRSFGEGERRKIFITTADKYGNHVTSVFDRNGKQIMERFKSIGQRENFGDKFVKTIKKETAVPHFGTKLEIRESVYNSAGTRLGARETVFMPAEDYLNRTEYRYAGSKYVSKTVYEDWVRRTRYIPESGKLIYYNDKGSAIEHIEG